MPTQPTDRLAFASAGAVPPQFRDRAPMRSGTQPTRYHIEMQVQSDWCRTVHSFDNRQEARAEFAAIQKRVPTGWYRLVSETVLETVTP